MASFKTRFNAGIGLVLAAFLLYGGPALGADRLQVADASAGKKTGEPPAKQDDPEKEKKDAAGNNPLKEAFKKLVGKDEDKEGGKEENAQSPEKGDKKDAATLKAESKSEAGQSGDDTGKADEEKPKEGMIEKAFNKLVGNKQEEDQAKEEAEKAEAESIKAGGDPEAQTAEDKEQERKEKTSETAKKFLSDTIDKIVDSVKGGKKEDAAEEGSDEPAQVAADKPQDSPTEPKSELEPKEGEVQSEEASGQNTNPLKEAFKKLVGKDEAKKEGEVAAGEQKE